MKATEPAIESERGWTLLRKYSPTFTLAMTFVMASQYLLSVALGAIELRAADLALIKGLAIGLPIAGLMTAFVVKFRVWKHQTLGLLVIATVYAVRVAASPEMWLALITVAPVVLTMLGFVLMMKPRVATATAKVSGSTAFDTPSVMKRSLRWPLPRHA